MALSRVLSVAVVAAFCPSPLFPFSPPAGFCPVSAAVRHVGVVWWRAVRWRRQWRPLRWKAQCRRRHMAHSKAVASLCTLFRHVEVQRGVRKCRRGEHRKARAYATRTHILIPALAAAVKCMGMCACTEQFGAALPHSQRLPPLRYRCACCLFRFCCVCGGWRVWWVDVLHVCTLAVLPEVDTHTHAAQHTTQHIGIVA